MATRLLLRSFRFRRPPPSPAHSPGSSHLANDLQHHLLHRSPPPQVPQPRGVLFNIRRFGGRLQHSSSSSSKAATASGRRVLANMLSASFVSTSVGFLSDHLSNQKSPSKGPHDREKRLCTDTLVAVNILVHIVDVATNRKLALWGAKVNDLVREGQIWRMATSSLLHADLAHLTVHYLVTGLPLRLLSVRPNAICGLIGAQAVYSWRHRETLKKANETLADIAILIASNLFIAVFTKHRVDHWAHLEAYLVGRLSNCFSVQTGNNVLQRVESWCSKTSRLRGSANEK